MGPGATLTAAAHGTLSTGSLGFPRLASRAGSIAGGSSIISPGPGGVKPGDERAATILPRIEAFRRSASLRGRAAFSPLSAFAPKYSFIDIEGAADDAADDDDDEADGPSARGRLAVAALSRLSAYGKAGGGGVAEGIEELLTATMQARAADERMSATATPALPAWAVVAAERLVPQRQL